MRTWRFTVVLLLVLLGAALSLILLLQHHGEASSSSFVRALCGETESGCDAVNRSSFSEVGGVSLAALGLLFYLSLALLVALALAADDASRRAAAALSFLLVSFGLVFDVFLLGVQIFSLKTFCKLCLLTYVVSAAVLLLVWPAWRYLKSVRSFAQSITVRLTLVAWLLVSLILALAVFVGEQSLRSVARMPAPVLAEDEKEAEVMNLEEARREVERLRRLFDNPEELNQYITARKMRAYSNAAIQKIDISQAPQLGKPDAAVEVVIFSDFLCPWCRLYAMSLKPYLPMLAHNARIAFLNYPLDGACNASMSQSPHPSACLIALGSVCAQEEGRFWAYHDRAFESKIKQAQESDVLGFATEAGLDAASFKRCLSSSSAKNRLQEQIVEARRLGVNATPTTFVNGRRLPNSMDVLLAVQHELARTGSSQPTRSRP